MRDRSDAEFRAEYRRRVECVRCGCVFEVGEPRRFSGEGRTEGEARRQADRKAGRWATANTPKGPCPACGRLPAGVVSLRRRTRHAAVTVTALGLIAALLSRTLEPGRLDTDLIAVGVAAVAGLAGLIHGALAFGRPHGNPVANRERADAAVRNGTVRVVSEGDSLAEADTLASRLRALAALVIGIVATLLALAAPAVRWTNGWPADPHLGPLVCGPGDEVTVYFEQRVDTLEGRWTGRPVTNAEYQVNGVAKRVVAASRANGLPWDRDSIKSYGSPGPTVLSVVVTLPADAVPGNSVHLDLEMVVSYPRPAGDKQFEVAQTTVRQTQDVRLATPGAASLYMRAFWGGTISAAALVGMFGAFLSELSFPGRASVMRVTAERV